MVVGSSPTGGTSPGVQTQASPAPIPSISRSRRKLRLLLGRELSQQLVQKSKLQRPDPQAAGNQQNPWAWENQQYKPRAYQQCTPGQRDHPYDRATLFMDRSLGIKLTAE